MELIAASQIEQTQGVTRADLVVSWLGLGQVSMFPNQSALLLK